MGDEVYARPRDLRIGTFAEYIAIDQDDVAPKPDSLTCTRRRRCRWCHWLPGRPSSTAPT